jgi:hypothetical protein
MINSNDLLSLLRHSLLMKSLVNGPTAILPRARICIARFAKLPLVLNYFPRIVIDRRLICPMTPELSGYVILPLLIRLSAWVLQV